jgi:hypothetical protein
MYQAQAEGRMRTVPAVLGLILLLLITLLVGFAVVATIAPLVSLLKSVTG